MSRFQFSDPVFELPDVESVLDALEAAVVGPETPMFDAARQSWQPVARHPEVRAAWEVRERYRPPGSPLELPPLSDDAEPLEADEGETTIIVVDFDVAQNFVIQGNPDTPAGIHGILFTPTLAEKSRDQEDNDD